MKRSCFKGCFYSKAFTLIELLVVVLIIGILAAVAVPQYRKVVEKTHATQAIILVKTIAEAGRMYFLEKGVYPTRFDELDIQVPTWPGNKLLNLNLSTQTFSDKNWNISLYQDTNNNGVRMERIAGPYMGAAFQWAWKGRAGSESSWNKLLCIEEYAYYKDKEGSYCKALFNGKKFAGNTQEIAYTLP